VGGGCRKKQNIPLKKDTTQEKKDESNCDLCGVCVPLGHRAPPGFRMYGRTGSEKEGRRRSYLCSRGKGRPGTIPESKKRISGENQEKRSWQGEEDCIFFPLP